jgi:Concanavalin A-like lectin/glucanases superfamily
VDNKANNRHPVIRSSRLFGTININNGILLGSLLGSLSLLPGCEDQSGDPRFKAETFDEYTEPLTNAVIGTPTATLIVNAVGGDGGVTGVGGAIGAVDGGGPRIDGGTSLGGRSGGPGGSVGTAGSSGTVDGGRPPIDGGGGPGGIGDGGVTGPRGRSFWHFDDCSPSSHFLIDSAGMGANAQQALNAACVPGISGQGVQIRTGKDIIQVPDEPQFTLSQRIAVAAWVHPDNVTGDQPIIIKRLNNQTAFSLGIHNGNIEMSVVLTTGKTFISRAPISPGVFTHVAGMYDGTFVFLFINGQQFGQVFAAGTLRNVFAPIRIGATTQSQSFHGIIDEVFLSTENIDKSVLTALACVRRPSTVSVSPAASGPVGPDTPFHYGLSITDNDVGVCGPKTYQEFVNFFEQGINVTFDAGQFQSASPGQTLDVGVSVTATEDAAPGSHVITVGVFSFGQNFEQLFATLNFEFQLPACFVARRRELMITDVGVVEDPARTNTFFGGPNSGVWSLGHLLREVAPTPEDAPELALRLFQSWLTDQSVNGFTVSARPSAQQLILDQWPKTATGALDLDQPPFRLQAIVNRMDLGDLSAGSAGQGRFVFALHAPGDFSPQQFTLIMEFNLPAATNQDVVDWANRWHALATHPFPSEEYNAALEVITRRITDRNGAPARVNGSNLLQLRTNEVALSFFGRWELREFQLSPDTGFFEEATVKDTPDLGFNGSATLGDFTNQNEAAIIAEIPGVPTTTVPLSFEGQPFLAASVFNDLIAWNAFNILNPEARFHVSTNTCNGCHGPDTNTTFLMVNPRFPGQEASLSGFLTGTTVFDPFTGQSRTLNELGRRATALAAVVCPPAGATPVATVLGR